ncbi:MAG: phosphoribosylamine--glycine ligase [Phenylobacterium sp.]|nr:MAG: phosphoribosylamine--glycine ligase [Phenylobacterium sp.]
MRVLGVSETCDLAALYLALQAEGHEVRVAISEPEARGTLAGLCPTTADWRAELAWIRQVGEDGIVVFESVSEGFGALQDQLRADGFQVIGGSAYGDRLENDRAYAQDLLAELGFPSGHVWTFPGPHEALAFIADNPGRYVLKYSGPDHASSDNYLGQLADGADVVAVLRSRSAAAPGAGDPLILMRFIEGVEMGVGAYFNGEAFIRPACLDWEHKRFFNGDLGELTGEMGTVVTYDRTERFFERTLARMEPHLRAHGHVGYVNLNTIVNDAGIWPLEFSCRFGYPGYAILSPLQADGWGDLLHAMVRRTPARMATRPGFCLGVVLTTPPFPYTRKQVAEPVGLPVLIEGGLDLRRHHLGEVGLDAAGQLVTSGLYGWTLVATGEGPTIAQAQREAYRTAQGVFAPNLRYRTDIGDRLIKGDYQRVADLGLLDD